MKEFIEKIPKAELHLHIEGSLEPELMFKLAKRNAVDIPYKSVEEIRAAYKFSCLQDFLDIYYQGASVLLKEEDFYDLAMDYFKQCKRQNIQHTEIMFDPQTHTHRGVEFETVLMGLVRAQEEAKSKWGISSFLIMSYLRHLSEEDAFKTLEQSLPFKDKIKAVGLDSSERGNPPSKFKNVFKASIDQGYIPLAHAGEEGDSDYVWEALEELNIVRIDHGNNALQDPELIQTILDRDMALTICPLSNTALQVVKNLNEHPLKKMIDLGLAVTVNSDDPAYFGGQLDENFFAIKKSLNLSKEEIRLLAINSFKYSLLDEDQKNQKIQAILKFMPG